MILKKIAVVEWLDCSLCGKVETLMKAVVSYQLPFSILGQRPITLFFDDLTDHKNNKSVEGLNQTMID